MNNLIVKITQKGNLLVLVRLYVCYDTENDLVTVKMDDPEVIKNEEPGAYILYISQNLCFPCRFNGYLSHISPNWCFSFYFKGFFLIFIQNWLYFF